jgi:hypothetical protein
VNLTQVPARPAAHHLVYNPRQASFGRGGRFSRESSTHRLAASGHIDESTLPTVKRSTRYLYTRRGTCPISKFTIVGPRGATYTGNDHRPRWTRKRKYERRSARAERRSNLSDREQGFHVQSRNSSGVTVLGVVSAFHYWLYRSEGICDRVRV